MQCSTKSKPKIRRHYLPTLAKHIVDQNEAAPAEEKLNLKGFLVGNPLTVRAAAGMVVLVVSIHMRGLYAIHAVLSS